MTLPILVTGVAGFVGAALAARLLDRGESVIGVDNLDPHGGTLAIDRLAPLERHYRHTFYSHDIADPHRLTELFRKHRLRAVIHMAGVTSIGQSINHPAHCLRTNGLGFAHLLEGLRRHGPVPLLYGSSYAVTALENPASPLRPMVSPYVVTCRTDELLAGVARTLYGIPSVGLRYSTLYGPWARADMVPQRLIDEIIEGHQIDLSRYGGPVRDFLSIETAVDRTVELLDAMTAGEPVEPVVEISEGRLTTLDAVVGYLRAIHEGNDEMPESCDVGPLSAALVAGLARQYDWARDRYEATRKSSALSRAESRANGSGTKSAGPR